MESEYISIWGARQHNLKNINVSFPRNKLIVVTGISGSGKSTLAFDTLYAEGQRRYVESLSAYARQFFERMEKPDVDLIEGLSPAIAIEQKTASHNPRSTVGTVTEIYDYLRLLFARIGKSFCYQCGNAIDSQTLDQMIDKVLSFEKGTRIIISSSLIVHQKGTHEKIFKQLKKEGFARVRVNGEILDIDQITPLNKHKPHSIDVIVDRLIVSNTIRNRLADSLELALSQSNGQAMVDCVTADSLLMGSRLLFNEKAICTHCGIHYPEFTPASFSFNSPQGACPKCDGLGSIIEPTANLKQYMTFQPCSLCNGQRLNSATRSVKINDLNVSQITAFTVQQAQGFFVTLKLKGKDEIIAKPILKEIVHRLEFLCDVGLSYLTLDRPAYTLSGGEGQRIRLATQIGSKLSGVLYVLDEPSIGLHQRDNQRLLKTLMEMRDLGNTVLVVEHDEETIRRSDHVIDMGPGAGTRGGEVVFSGTPEALLQEESSLTGLYLSGKKKIEIPKKRRPGNAKYLTIEGAAENNLKSLDVSFPLGRFICVTGVSGSGKSTLVLETLYRVLSQHLNHSKGFAGKHLSVRGIENIDKVVHIDQSPIGKTPRSNPGTYTGVFTFIREIFSKTAEARMRGYKANRFSFNVKGGRCEACGGDGVIRIEMHFLPDVYVTCEGCHGKRYNRETLDIRYKGENISDILDMTVSQALRFFERIHTIRQKLETLVDVGLGYIRLGQPATTLSGGEAQRIKLSSELSKKATGKTVYILDEPTTGLHMEDIQKLIKLLFRLVDMGNTVIVIEHHMDVIKMADHIIDLGPEGGDRGGYIIGEGTPEEIIRVTGSYTGQFLKKVLTRQPLPIN